jgi:hypothetical protein
MINCGEVFSHYHYKVKIKIVRRIPKFTTILVYDPSFDRRKTWPMYESQIVGIWIEDKDAR